MENDVWESMTIAERFDYLRRRVESIKESVKDDERHRIPLSYMSVRFTTDKSVLLDSGHRLMWLSHEHDWVVLPDASWMMPVDERIKDMVPVKLSDLNPGDLVVYRGCPGIYVGGDEIVTVMLGTDISHDEVVDDEPIYRPVIP